MLRNQTGLEKLPDPTLTGIPVIVAAELWTGVKKNLQTHPHQAARLEAFLSLFWLADFTLDAALHYADIRAALEATGTIIGPVIVDYYLCNRMRFRAELLDRLPAWNPIAVVAFAIGAASAWFAPPWIANGLFGLLVSMVAYGVLYALTGALGIRLGHARAVAESGAGTR